MENARILVVDDDTEAQRAVSRVLSREGYGIDSTGSAGDALRLLEKERFDLVLTDVRMDGMTGIELLRRVRDQWPGVPVVVMTSFAGVETAVSAIEEGAFDYISKPYDIGELRSTVRRALDQGRARAEVEKAGDSEAPDSGPVEIVGRSPAMAVVYKKIALVARGAATVLIEGETGSGKELVARAIHRNSSRRQFPFVAVNCGAFSETLLESELFGHVKGAFTGATTHRRGLFETANHGTVFLDEIGETTPSMQTRLLRVLEEREIQRLGSMDAIPVDLRVITASNRKLSEMSAGGEFREDLYYRLNVVTIAVPSLRERLSDVPLLFDAFVKRHGGHRQTPLAVDPAVMEMLMTYSWPGNVRELENAVERAIALNTTGLLTREDFAEELQGRGPASAVFPETLVALEDIERQYVEHVISRVDGNMSRAAEVLGIDRRTLYRMLERFGSGRQESAASEPPETGPVPPAE